MVKQLTLNDILFTYNIIDRFEDIQLIDCRTGEVLTGIDYIEDSGFYSEIETYLNRSVICIRPKLTNEDELIRCTNYLEIRLGDEITND